MARDTGSKINKGTKIIPCVCSHEYQDQAYGKGKRVHNGKSGSWRCTVCKKENN